MIDLHLHTTASDGTLQPSALVERAQQAGIRTLSVTDHDTMVGVPAAAEAAAGLGLEFLPGIEITAVLGRRDVHMLGYFLDPGPPGLESFLQAQLKDRLERARKMVGLLRDLGAPLNMDALLEQSEVDGRAVARPLIARALVQARHVGSEQEAFDRWLGDGATGLRAAARGVARGRRAPHLEGGRCVGFGTSGAAGPGRSDSKPGEGWARGPRGFTTRSTIPASRHTTPSWRRNMT